METDGRSLLPQLQHLRRDQERGESTFLEQKIQQGGQRRNTSQLTKLEGSRGYGIWGSGSRSSRFLSGFIGRMWRIIHSSN